MKYPHILENEFPYNFKTKGNNNYSIEQQTELFNAISDDIFDDYSKWVNINVCIY